MLSDKPKLQILSVWLAISGSVIGLVITIGLFFVQPNLSSDVYIAETLLIVFLNSAMIILTLWVKEPLLAGSIWALTGMIQTVYIFFSLYELKIFLFPNVFLLFAAAFIIFLENLQQEKVIEANDSYPYIATRQASTVRSEDGSVLGELTQRERQILVLIARGHSNQEIAQELVISQNTVRHHVHSILTKLGCSSRSKAAALAIRAGILKGDLEN
jgi:DNA-binding CsgD family transcriptional regulator